MKIAIIGTGIAGLGAAHALSRLHEVELFEANGYAGGHANTIAHDSLSYCEARFAIRSLGDMLIVLSYSANDSLPEFSSIRPGY